MKQLDKSPYPLPKNMFQAMIDSIFQLVNEGNIDRPTGEELSSFMLKREVIVKRLRDQDPDLWYKILTDIEGLSPKQMIEDLEK